MDTLQPPEKGIKKLCGVQGCCPTIDFIDPDFVTIRDDFGGAAKLTRAQWEDLKQGKFAPQDK